MNAKHFEFISARSLNQGHVGDVVEAAPTFENKRKWFGNISVFAKESTCFNQALMLLRVAVMFDKRSSVLDAWPDKFSTNFKSL